MGSGEWRGGKGTEEWMGVLREERMVDRVEGVEWSVLEGRGGEVR